MGNELKRESKVIRCHCASEYQDKKHGKFMRVHNPCFVSKQPAYRCTQCGNEKRSD